MLMMELDGTGGSERWDHDMMYESLMWLGKVYCSSNCPWLPIHPNLSRPPPAIPGVIWNQIGSPEMFAAGEPLPFIGDQTHVPSSSCVPWSKDCMWFVVIHPNPIVGILIHYHGYINHYHYEWITIPLGGKTT